MYSQMFFGLLTIVNEIPDLCQFFNIRGFADNRFSILLFYTVIRCMAFSNLNIKGLSDQQVLRARESHGSNQLQQKKSFEIIEALKDVVGEPMFILLAAAATIYFIIGDIGDGIFMALSIVLV